MHILHLTPYYAPAYAFGGVVRSVEGMTRALVRRGHSVTVLTTDAFDQTHRIDVTDETLAGVNILRAPNLSMPLRGRYNLSTPHGLRSLLRPLLSTVDVIHTHEFRTAENLLLTPLAARAKIPLVLSPHGTLTPSTGRSALKNIWDRLLSPAVARRFQSIIGLTAVEVAEVQSMWSGFGANAAFDVVPNGIDPTDYADLPGREAFRQRYGLGDAPVCLFMGRLHQRKGVQILLEAFKAAAVPNARLLIVGPDEGMLSTLQSLADDRVIFTGYLGGADRLAAFAAADLLALPAVGEGLPMVVLEAMASGLPVIVSPGCNLPDVAQFGAGLEVVPEVEALAAALRQLLPDASQRATMSVNARRLVNEKFTWNQVAASLESIYLRLISRGKTTPTV